MIILISTLFKSVNITENASNNLYSNNLRNKINFLDMNMKSQHQIMNHLRVKMSLKI